MDHGERERRRQVFGRAVEAYDRTRPGYPADAVSWCLGAPSGSVRVGELGAGSGKLTEVLLALGHRVVAIEPDATMLDRLQQRLGTMSTGSRSRASLEVRRGPAEDIPLADGAVDVVVAGQAWHWFEPGATGREVRRVLRPGGVVAAIWNTRDRSVDWVDQWSRIVMEDTHPTGRAAMLADDLPDADWEVAEFHQVQRLAVDDLRVLAASRSHTITLTRDDRAEMLAAVDDLARSHPDLAGRDTVDLPYVVECHRARLG